MKNKHDWTVWAEGSFSSTAHDLTRAQAVAAAAEMARSIGVRGVVRGGRADGTRGRWGTFTITI